MREKLSAKLNFRVTSNMATNINNTARQLNLRPADVVRASLAIGLKSLSRQRTIKTNGVKNEPA